jgi:uncharacterized protein YndB with AHSA1/START domain
MARNTAHIDAPPAAVFAVLADAHTYEHWVVGCKEIRDADDGWPAPGTMFHHRVGVGPLNTADYTQVISVDRPRCLVLRARARPLGTARVTFELAATGTGMGTGTDIVMLEGPLSDWTRRLWNPVLDKLTYLRNVETLRRLKKLVEARATMET